MSSDAPAFDATDPAAYGDVWADFLDEWLALTCSVPPAGFVDLIGSLADEAGGRRVLELAVGTGFLALPLVEKGMEVHGLDGSVRMLEILAAKPGGSALRPWLADLGGFQLSEDPDKGPLERFEVIFFGSSSIFCLPDQEAQVRCFESAARHLTEHGLFVLSTAIYDDRWFTDGQLDYIQAEGDDWRMHWHAVHQPAQQVVDVMRTLQRDGEPDRHFPHRERYCQPAELDRMARLAGLGLCHRWRDWLRSPFTGHDQAVSVYKLD